MKTVNTVTGPLLVEKLGKTLMHEHIISSSAGIAENYPELNRPDAHDRIVQDLEEMKRNGISSVVDANPFDLGRDVNMMRRCSEETGVHIIACTGFFLEPNPMLGAYKPEDLAKCFIRELTEGIGNTGIKAGILKTAMDKEGPTPGRELVHRAVAIASRETGAPVMLHSCPQKEMGKYQIQFMKEEGAELKRVKIDHCLETTDIDYLLWVYDQGCWLGVDRLPIVCAEEDYRGSTSMETRIMTIKRMIEAGMGDRMLFSHDFMSVSTFFDHMPTQEDQSFVDHLNPMRFGFLQNGVFARLEELGVSREQLERMLEDNPRRFFEAC